MGRALKGAPRTRCVIATKFGHPSRRRPPRRRQPEYVRQAVEESLRRLDTDHIDLFQLHQPDP